MTSAGDQKHLMLHIFLGSAIGFIDRLDAEWERKRKIKDDAKTFGLSDWEGQIFIHCDEKD